MYMLTHREFRDILLQNGFPEEMSVKHVRKKWSYTYDVSIFIKSLKFVTGISLYSGN